QGRRPHRHPAHGRHARLVDRVSPLTTALGAPSRQERKNDGLGSAHPALPRPSSPTLPAQDSNSTIGLLPLSTIRTGRLLGVVFTLLWLMPRMVQTVAMKSIVEIGLSTTVAPSLSVLPTTCPLLMPPPIIRLLQARG